MFESLLSTVSRILGLDGSSKNYSLDSLRIHILFLILEVLSSEVISSKEIVDYYV